MNKCLPDAEGPARTPVTYGWNARSGSPGGVTRFNIRPVPLALTTLVHCLLLGLLMLPGQRLARAAESQPMATFDVAPPAPLAPAPKPAQPEPIVETRAKPVVVPPVEIPVAETPIVVALLKQADAQAASGSCDLSAPVEAALRVSGDVRKTLPQIPRSRRSVANAIMVWNAQWTMPQAESDLLALTAIREVVADTIAAASDACRLQPQAGPRLLTVPASKETIVLALGSGRWRWQDMLDTAKALEVPSSDALPAAALGSAASEASQQT